MEAEEADTRTRNLLKNMSRRMVQAGEARMIARQLLLGYDPTIFASYHPYPIDAQATSSQLQILYITVSSYWRVNTTIN
jgi:hypothetical protein